MNKKLIIIIFTIICKAVLHGMEKQDNSGISPTVYRHSPGIFHRDISPKGTTLTIQKEGHNEIMKVHIPENQQYKLKYKVKNEDPEQNTRLHNTQ